MKQLALLVALVALGGATVRAQDNHQGPVVYPVTPVAPAHGPAQAPDGSVSVSAPAVMAPDTNSDLATPLPGTSANNASPTPDASAPAPAPINPPMPDASAPAAAAPASSAPLNPQSTLTPGGGANGKPDDIYDIRQPYFSLVPLTWLWITLAVLALIGLGVTLWFWLAPLRARRAKTAYELALEKLEKARAMLNEKDPEPYAVFVSETIRTYLGQRFHSPSTRRTTEEFLRQMQTDTTTPLAAHRDLLRGFLEACDLVKFAHYEPGREELEQVQQRAVSFVTATRPLEGASA
jgi:hypothetical protein